MVKKILSYGVVGMLALVLLGGTAYLILSPSHQAEYREVGTGQGTNRGYGRNQGVEAATASDSEAVQGGGNRHAEVDTEHNNDQRNIRDSGLNGQAGEPVVLGEWETVRGVVSIADNELVVQTAEGEVTVGLGQASYREAAGFTIHPGDEVLVNGFEEEGEFKAASVENLTSGERLVLRDTSGRPMWAGRGNLKNQP